MIVLAIPVKILELVRILLADTTAAVQQDLLENNVKMVRLFKKAGPSSVLKGKFPIMLLAE